MKGRIKTKATELVKEIDLFNEDTSQLIEFMGEAMSDCVVSSNNSLEMKGNNEFYLNNDKEVINNDMDADDIDAEGEEADHHDNNHSNKQEGKKEVVDNNEFGNFMVETDKMEMEVQGKVSEGRKLMHIDVSELSHEEGFDSSDVLSENLYIVQQYKISLKEDKVCYTDIVKLECINMKICEGCINQKKNLSQIVIKFSNAKSKNEKVTCCMLGNSMVTRIRLMMTKNLDICLCILMIQKLYQESRSKLKKRKKGLQEFQMK